MEKGEGPNRHACRQSDPAVVSRRPQREAVIASRKPVRRKGCRKYLGSLGTIFVFAILFGAGALFFLYRALTTPYKGYGEPSKLVEVRHGIRTATILKHLRTDGVLRDEFIPLLYLKVARRNDSLKAGVYEFRQPMTAVDVLDRIIRGDVILKTVTVREGLDRFAVGDLFASEGFGHAADWEKATAEAEQVHDIDPNAKTLEGYLFPDTYKLTPGTPPKAIVEKMVQNFRKHFGGEMNYISTGLDLHDTVTLASIVETEARKPEERPVVASVYLNRTRMGMPLQADPTVIYALKLAHRWDGNIHKSDLSMESPYNTYHQRGFPPGPIASPGLASLRAAANPAKTSYVYFVARNDGTHAFSTTLAEHNQNVDVYQRQYWKNRHP